MAVPVVMVHGLWMTGFELAPLAWHLRRCGFAPRRFPYADLRRTPAENAVLLQDWLAGVPGDEVHIVAHSLGGILLLHLFDRFPRQRPGRVVFLGTPAGGCAVARRLQQIPCLRGLLGRSGVQGLLGGAPGWRGGRELGVVAGTSGLGIGRLFVRLEPPHDGTVTVAETRLPGVTDAVTVAAGHMGMLLSAKSARQVCTFLGTGRFDRRGDADDGDRA